MRKSSIYFILVIAVVLCSFSNALAVSSPTAVSPAVPYGQAGPYYSTRIPTFSCTPVEGATWYQIYLSYANSTGTALLKQWVRGINSWKFDADFDLYPGSEYSWWVRAYDGSYSSWSNRADFVVGSIKILSLHPGAFSPFEPDSQHDFYQGGVALKPLQNANYPSVFNVWIAPIMLPDKARSSYIKLYNPLVIPVIIIHPDITPNLTVEMNLSSGHNHQI